MSANEVREYLREEYGLETDEDIAQAINSSGGIDIGIFTQRNIGEIRNLKELKS